MTIRKKKCNATENFYPFHRAFFSARCTSNFFLLTSFCAFFPTFFLQFNIQSADAVFIIMKKTKYKCKNLLTISKKYMYTTVYMKYEAAAIFRRKSEVREELREEKKKLLKASFYFTSMPLPVCCCCCCFFFALPLQALDVCFILLPFNFNSFFMPLRSDFFLLFLESQRKIAYGIFAFFFLSSSSLQWVKIHRISRDEWMKKNRLKHFISVMVGFVNDLETTTQKSALYTLDADDDAFVICTPSTSHPSHVKDL